MGFCGTLWVYLKTFWFFLCGILRRTVLNKPIPAHTFHHKILIIGDSGKHTYIHTFYVQPLACLRNIPCSIILSFIYIYIYMYVAAEGFGDYIVLGSRPGLDASLHNQIVNDKRMNKHSWSVHNLGVSGSTTTHWLPDASTKPKCLESGRICGCLNSKNLYSSTVLNKSYLDADIVVLILGNDDYRAGVKVTDSRANIKTIIDDLISRGKIVFVDTIPVPEFEDEPRYSETLMYNEQIREIGTWLSGKQYPDVLIGADLAKITRSSQLIGGYYPNSRLYREWASLLYKKMSKTLVRVEYRALFGERKRPEKKTSSIESSSVTTKQESSSATQKNIPKIKVRNVTSEMTPLLDADDDSHDKMD